MGIYLPGSLYSVLFLLYSCGSLFGVPSRVRVQGLGSYLEEYFQGLGFN